MNEGVVVELIEGLSHQEYWTVRVINTDGSYGDEGLVASTYLELKDSTIIESDEEVKEKSKSLEHRE